MRDAYGHESSGPGVMVVDDAPWILEYVGRFLGERGFTVSTASNAAEAMELFDRVHPQLVLLDITLPDSNGLVLMQELHRVDPRVPVIIVTGADDGLLTAKALELGAVATILKPIESRELACLVERHTQTRAANARSE